MHALPAFEHVLGRHALSLARDTVRTVQVNLGRRCNQACRHCHLEAGPARGESMSRQTLERLLEAISRTPGLEQVEATGGAPELHPALRFLIERVTALGLGMTVRTNLTVLLEPELEPLIPFYAGHGVRLVASLPCYTEANVDRQRGRGVFVRSVQVLRQLNRAGYGIPGSGRVLDLVHNPLGALLPAEQGVLEQEYRESLRRDFGIEFNRLLALTNAAIGRFAEDLAREGGAQAYGRLLVDSFNPATVTHLMCRHQMSVDWDGRLYDCDFNLALEQPLAGGPLSIWEIESLGELGGGPIRLGQHCFACTAGHGSSCGGALLDGTPAG